MKIRKSVMVAGTAITLGLTSLVGVKVASAQTSSSSTGVSGLVEKIATKFNLKKEDVQKVFDDNKAAKQADRQAEQSKQLQSLVDSGKITAAQKVLIENKQKELQAARETERTALEKWATDNGIDAKYVLGFGGHRDDNKTDRLQAAVDAKEITADQKAKIEAKQAELKTARDASQADLKKWATDNKIDLQYLRGFGGPGRGHGMMSGDHDGMMN